VVADEPVSPLNSSQANRVTPQHTVVVRLSENVLQDAERATLRERSDVRMIVLGVPVRGTADTTGVVSADFAHHRAGAAFDLTLRGTAVSRTVGRKGPATVCSVVRCDFVAHKPVLFDLRRGFTAGPVTVDAQTHVVSQNVQSRLPGIRGRIVKRVAWNRIQRDRTLLDAIAESVARQRIEASFEQVAAARLAKLNTRFHELRLALAANRARQPGTEVNLFTTDRYLEICVGPAGTGHAPTLPEGELPAHPVQVWIHSSAVDADAPRLMQTWELLRRVLLPGAVAIGGAPRIELQTRRGAVPLHVETVAPWVIIGAGEPEPKVRMAAR
jgi:hypothetical protein